MSAPVVGTLSVDADLMVQIPIDDMGSAAFVRVDYAVPPDGYEPDEASHLWRTIETIESEATVETPAQTYGVTVWVRASGRTSSGEPQSAYVTDSIAIDDVPRLASVSFALEGGTAPAITWTAADTCDGVRVLWAVHDVNAAAGSLGESADIEASEGTYRIDETLDLGEAITVRVEAWESWDSAHETVDGDKGLSVTETLVRTVATPSALPVRHLVTYEYTLQAIDAGAYLRIEHESGATLIVPADATLTFAVGTTVWVEQTGAGQVTVEPEDSEPTLNALDSQLGTSGQYAVCRLVKTAPDTWTWHGDIAS